MNNYIIFIPKDNRILYAISWLSHETEMYPYRLDINGNNYAEIRLLINMEIFNLKKHDRGQIEVELLPFGRRCEVIHFPLRDGGYVLSGLRIPVE